MKYLIISNDSPGLGGAEESMLRVSGFLKDTCTLKFCISKYADLRVEESIKNAGFDYEYFNMPASAPNFFRGLIQAQRLVKKYKKQVFMIWCHHTDSNRWLQLWLALVGAKFILVERAIPSGKSDFDKSKLSIPIKRYVIRRAFSVILCASSQAEHFQSIFGKAKRLDIISNSRSIDDVNNQIRALKKTAISQFDLKGKVICYVGRLDPQKDQLTLIRAFAKVSKKHLCSLLLVGEGNDEQRLRKEVSDLELSNVFFTGYSTEVNKWLAISDLFVLSSLAEGLPGALIEAMAAGLPCIATDIPGNRDLIINNETGLLVPVSNANVLAEAIEICFDNPRKAQQFAANAYKKVLADYSTEGEKEKWVELINEVLSSELLKTKNKN